MKLENLDSVNHLVAELADIRSLIETAEHAEASAFQVYIEAQGDTGLRMSEEGASTSHSRGLGVSRSFLSNVKQLAVAELNSRQQDILKALADLGVETGS